MHIMKILIICSHRNYAPYTDYMAPFIYEQMHGLKELGCDFRVCFVKGGGWKAYLRAWQEMRTIIREFQPDIIHAHYGLCCMIANMQHQVPVISTYHGSDINEKKVRRISQMAIKRSKMNIFVSKPLMKIAGNPSRSTVIPCGVDVNIFYPMDRNICRESLGLDKEKVYILFSKEFSDTVKNYPLAKQAVDKLHPQAELLEFYGYTREQVPLLYNAVDLGLMTSFTEGSPQFVKEAIACGCPIVSTDVGDVRDVIEGVPNSFITTYEVNDVVDKMKLALSIGHLQESNLHDKYATKQIAKSIFDIYTAVCAKK